jgi:DNA-binding transcriptional LysR family regulator
MLELRRLRLLRELHERGTIAAVADALRYTPSAVSQQLGMLEREAGVPLLEKAGRGVRLTDAGLVLVEHASAMLERAARAEADLAAAAGEVMGRARIAGFQSALREIAIPVLDVLEREVPRLRCELVEREPEDALPELALGDLDVVIGDEWQHHPWRLPAGLERCELLRDPVRVVLPVGHPCARADAVAIADLAGEAWAAGHPGMGWEEIVLRTCRGRGGFDPDVRHRTNDATLALELVRGGRAVTMLPDLILPVGDPQLAILPVAGAKLERKISAVTRVTDHARPSTLTVLRALQDRAARIQP